jgi:molybdate transport system regulatory protein
LLLRDAEEMIGAPLIVTANGGLNGGGTKLSDVGRNVIARYRKIEKSACRAARADLQALTRITADRSGSQQQELTRTRAFPRRKKSA